MLKRYFMLIFMVSAVALNAMDDSDKITIFPWPKYNKIEATVSSPWQPGLYTHSVRTVVIKDRASNSFEVRAELCPSVEYRLSSIDITVEPDTVEKLKAKIVEYEKQMAMIK